MLTSIILSQYFSILVNTTLLVITSIDVSKFDFVVYAHLKNNERMLLDKKRLEIHEFFEFSFSDYLLSKIL